MFSLFPSNAVATALCAALPLVVSAAINDTGQTRCYDAADFAVPCSAAAGGDDGANPRQDARYGRDAVASAGQLPKIGAGAAGFDYTKIANSGSVLAASASLGGANADWACTRDNVTGLIWEVKTTTGLRAANHAYTWYSTDTTTNGGEAGVLGTNTCGGTLAAAPYNNQCNTQNYVAAVNVGVGMCGATDWRSPTRRELLSLINASQTLPALDADFFPNTNTRAYHWTRTNAAISAIVAWVVYFYDGDSTTHPKFGTAVIRLVSG